MGLDPKQSRPEWMVIKVLSVAPPPVRPSVEAGDGVRSEDDLTYAYREIIKMSKELKNRMDSGQPRGT
jgi:DNA-directed RNA polymerase subunit A'